MRDKKMPDFKNTKLLFEEQGLMKFWKRPGELLDDELFAQKRIKRQMVQSGFLVLGVS
jgi:hypothetical protein